MTAFHTLPWLVEHTSMGVRIVHGEPNEDGFRSDVPGLGFVGRCGDPNAVALAEFIVRACNAHFDLLISLRNLVQLAESRGFLHEYKAALDDARASIAKAEGRS